MYYRVILSGPTLDGEAGPLPREHVGLTDADLADFAAVANPCPEHLVGIGYWPVVEVVPEHDPALQRPAAAFTDEIDAPNKRVVRTFDLEDVPPPETAEPTSRPHLQGRLNIAPEIPDVVLGAGSCGVSFAMYVDVGFYVVYPSNLVPDGAVPFVNAITGLFDDAHPVVCKVDTEGSPGEIWIRCLDVSDPLSPVPHDPLGISIIVFATQAASGA